MNKQMRIKNIIACDVETKIVKSSHLPIMVGVCTKTEIIIFRKNPISSFFSFLIKKNRGYLYSHNFSNFDSYFFLKTLLTLDSKILRMFIKNNSIFYLEFKLGNNIYYFRDSYLLFQQKLNDIIMELTGYKTLTNLFVSNSNKRFVKYLIFDIIFLYYILCASKMLLKVYGMDIRKYITSTHFIYSLFLNSIGRKS